MNNTEPTHSFDYLYETKHCKGSEEPELFRSVTSPLIVVPALLSGFLVNPALYLWLGVIFLKGRRASLGEL
jgi:hypothetical protein